MMGGVEGGGVSILEGQKDIAVIGDGVCTKCVPSYGNLQRQVVFVGRSKRILVTTTNVYLWVFHYSNNNNSNNFDVYRHNGRHGLYFGC